MANVPYLAPEVAAEPVMLVVSKTNVVLQTETGHIVDVTDLRQEAAAQEAVLVEADVVLADAVHKVLL